jgi:hypothetical protein
MTTTNPSTNPLIPIGPRPTLSAPKALKIAWLCWSVLLLLPFTLVLWTLWNLHVRNTPLLSADADRWFVAAAAYLVAAATAAFFWRDHSFKGYSQGKRVEPGKYLVGTIGIGLALSTSGIFSLVGCIVTGAMVPNLIPALMALLVFVLLWPTGHAMVRSVGHLQDPQIYEEPR